MKRRVQAVGAFDYKAVVFSHGWSDLPPFHVERDDGTLRVVLRTADKPSVVRLGAAPGGIEVEAPTIGEDVVAAVRWMFRMDDDLSDFYERMRHEDRGGATSPPRCPVDS